MSSFVDRSNGRFHSVCSLDCPDQCGLIVHKRDGKITKIEGDRDHPVTKGFICNKVRHMADRIYDEKRLKYPMKRAGAKGEGQFVRISWDEAVDTIITRWKSLLQSDGPESILPYSFYGNMGNLSAEGMDRRFFNRLGASQLDRSICNAAGAVGYKYTMGASFGVDPEDTIQSKLFIFWGINAVSTNMHQATIAQQARKQHGAKIVVIDVHQNKTAKLADWFIPILPGTDTALALGVMHVLFSENMTDEAFLREFTVGYDALREHVVQYDPHTVSIITGVPAEDIVRLARMYGTTSPSFIRIGNGPQHHDNGGMFVRTISCLPALTGQWNEKGGGAIKGNSAYLAYNTDALQRPELLKDPNTRMINMNRLGEALLSLEPPVKSLYVYGTNPAVVAPSSQKVKKGLLRDDLFTVVHDLFMTETAKYADIVLPATSSFENIDFYTSYWHHYVQLQQPVIEPYFEAKSNVDVFRMLAKGMGFAESAFDETEEEMITQSLENPQNPYLKDINYETLAKHQYVKANASFPKVLPTPSGKIELYSERMKKDGYPPLPTYIPLQEEADHHFQFIAAPNHNFMNSTFANQSKHTSLEKEPLIVLHRLDAEMLNIRDGEQVRVWNAQGEVWLKADVGDSVLQGVAVTQGLWENDQDSKRLVNTLTPDRIADMGGGAVFFSGKVSIEKIK
ncbi:molybdopterin-dependent oxidoreductase [Fictibacillus iocasae]|uniref:Molybdopterin-dependent oxidoreductase n=1 Tax=Fictibacillus iocasae TaxID=2715437 RepID=A0ABW2NQB7_9BACL